MALSLDTTPAKHVTVIKNGDIRHRGTRFIVNRKRYRTFESLLADITSHINPSFGAVRQLYTPTSGRKIESIEELDSGGTYVATGIERFKKLDYRAGNNADKGFVAQRYIPSVKPGYLADDPPPRQFPKRNKLYAQRSAQFYKVVLPIQFTVFKNGNPLEKGHKFLVQSKELKNYELILETISRKLRLNDGAVRRLYTTDGVRIISVDDLTDGGVYVATGSRKFVHAAYGEKLSVVRPPKLPPIQPRLQTEKRTQSNPVQDFDMGLDNRNKAKSEKDSPTPRRNFNIESNQKDNLDSKSPEDTVEQEESSPEGFYNPPAGTIQTREKSPDSMNSNIAGNLNETDKTTSQHIAVIPSSSTHFEPDDTTKKRQNTAVNEVHEKEDSNRKPIDSLNDVAHKLVTDVLDSVSSSGFNGAADIPSEPPINSKSPVLESLINNPKSIAVIANPHDEAPQTNQSTVPGSHSNSSELSQPSVLQQHNGLNNGYDAIQEVKDDKDGNFLMTKQEEILSSEHADVVKEDTGLVEDKPINLQQAAEVRESLE